MITLDAYRSELKILQEQLLPSADALNKANSDALETTYADQESKAGSHLSRHGACYRHTSGGTAGGYTQIYLRLKFRRRFNVPLLLATVGTVLFVQWLSGALADNSRNLRTAKEDAYNSISALLSARRQMPMPHAQQRAAGFLTGRTQMLTNDIFASERRASPASPPDTTSPTRLNTPKGS